MNWLTRVSVALLRRSTALLPANRRVWAPALWAEAYRLGFLASARRAA
jgi:hypothetical protein